MNSEFKKKYLKYKSKYLKLQGLIAGGESNLTPEQDRALAFFKLVDPAKMFVKKKDIIKNYKEFKLELERKVFSGQNGLEKTQEEFDKYKPKLQELEDEITIENNKIIKTGTKLKELKQKKEEYLTFVFRPTENKLTNIKLHNEVTDKLIPIFEKAIENLIAIYDNLQNYFEINPEQNTIIVKIKDLKTLIDDLISFSEIMISFFDLVKDTNDKLQKNKPETKDPFVYEYEYDFFEYKFDYLISANVLPGFNGYNKYTRDTDDVFRLHVAARDNLKSFRDEYLNTESNKYINSDIIFDKKTIESIPIIEQTIKESYLKGAITKAKYDELFNYGYKKTEYDDGFKKIPLGDVIVESHDYDGTTFTPNGNVRFVLKPVVLIPKINHELCPYDIPYCNDNETRLKVANEKYPSNYIRVSRESNNNDNKHVADTNAKNLEGGKPRTKYRVRSIETNDRKLNDEKHTDLRFISTETIEKLIIEKLKDPTLSELDKKLLNRKYYRAKRDDYRPEYNQDQISGFKNIKELK